jgi:hypothetical protein
MNNSIVLMFVKRLFLGAHAGGPCALRQAEAEALP